MVKLETYERAELLKHVMLDKRPLHMAVEGDPDDAAYKAADAEGNIWIVGNPHARHAKFDPASGYYYIQHKKPRIVYTYEQIQRELKAFDDAEKVVHAEARKAKKKKPKFVSRFDQSGLRSSDEK